MRGTKEFYELMAQFEKDMSSPDCSIYVYDFSRSKEGPSFYDNGQTNSLFYAYMLGYQFSKCLSQP